MQRVLLTCLAVLAAMAAGASDTRAARGSRWNADYFTNLPVVNQDGKALRFYDDLIKGKIVVVSFIYTTCADLCPITTARLREVKGKLGDIVGPDVSFLSITVDPEHDTPAMLKAFADAFDTGPRWQFVTGKPKDIETILRKFGDNSGDRGLSQHRNEVMIGNDATGDWERASPFEDLDRLAVTIREMDPKWRGRVRQPTARIAASAGYRVGAQPGQAMFKKLCEPCHTIGAGKRVGPDLRGVTDRRDPAWLTAFIRDPVKVLADKDPTALALAAEFPGVRMPRLGVSKVDAADLITYLRAESSRLSAPESDHHAPDHHHDRR